MPQRVQCRYATKTWRGSRGMWGSPQCISILCGKTSFDNEQRPRPDCAYAFWRLRLASLVFSAPSTGTARHQLGATPGQDVRPGSAPSAAFASERAWQAASSSPAMLAPRRSAKSRRWPRGQLVGAVAWHFTCALLSHRLGISRRGARNLSGGKALAEANDVNLASIQVELQLDAAGAALYSLPLEGNNAPIGALKEILQLTLERLAIGCRHLQSEGVVAGWHNLSPDLQARASQQMRQWLSLAISDSPGGGHDKHSVVNSNWRYVGSFANGRQCRHTGVRNGEAATSPEHGERTVASRCRPPQSCDAGSWH